MKRFAMCAWWALWRWPTMTFRRRIRLIAEAAEKHVEERTIHRAAHDL
jgi:hypothetical protein